jgi:hypothetical protein
MRRLLAALALVAFAAPLSAQAAKPSFVGTWTMDAARSESDGSALPAAITWTIAQHGDTLVWGRETTYEAGSAALASKVSVGTDGRPWPNKVPQPDGTTREASYALTWDGPTMVVTITSEIEGNAILQVDRLTKSADGATLSVARTLSVDGEEVAKATMVFIKPKS